MFYTGLRCESPGSTSKAIERPLFAGSTLIMRASEEDFHRAKPGLLNRFMATESLSSRSDRLPKARGLMQSSLAIGVSFWVFMSPTVVRFFWLTQGRERLDLCIPGRRGPHSM